MATACFYPTDLHTGTLGEGKNADTLVRVREIGGELAMIWGRQDPHIPADGRAAIDRALTEAGRVFTWREVNAEHAFMRDEGPRDDPVARLALGVALALFQRTLESVAHAPPRGGMIGSISHDGWPPPACRVT